MPLITNDSSTGNIIPSVEDTIPAEPPEYSSMIARKAATASENFGEDYHEALSRYELMAEGTGSSGVQQEIKTKDLLARREARSEAISGALREGTTESVAREMQNYQLEDIKEDALERNYLDSLESKMSPELRELDEANPDLYQRKRRRAQSMGILQEEMARVGALEAAENILQETADFGKTIIGLPNLLDNNNPWEGTFSSQISDIRKKISFIVTQDTSVQPQLFRELSNELMQGRIFDNPQDVLDMYGLALGSTIDEQRNIFLTTTMDAAFIAGEITTAVKGAKLLLKSGATQTISDDIVQAQAMAGDDILVDDIINGTQRLVKDGDEAAEIMPFLRNPNGVVTSVSEKVSNRLHQNYAEVKRVAENFAAPERLHEVVANQAKAYEKDIIERQLIDSTIDSDTGMLVYTFGTTKGVPFKSKAAAQRAAEKKGIEDFTVEDSFSGYIVKVNTNTADVAKGFNEVGLVKAQLGNVSDVVKSLLPIAQRAEDASGAVISVVQKIINKDLAGFTSGGKKVIPLERVLDEAAKQKVWYNEQEFLTTFKSLNGRQATDKELKAYWAYGQLNDLSYILSVKPALGDIAARGDDVFELKGLVDDTQVLSIAGRKVDDNVALGSLKNKENIMVWGDKPRFFEKGAANVEEFSGYTILEVNPRWSQKFMELGHSDVPAKYLAVPVGTSTRKAVATDIMNYLHGPRTSNASPFFIKSGQLVQDGSGGLHRLQDVSLASASSAKQAKEGAEKMSKLAQLMRGSKDKIDDLTDEMIAKIGLEDFGIATVKTADEWMKSSKLYDRDIKIQGVGNRETVDIDDAMSVAFPEKTATVDDYAMSSPHSQVLFGKRTEGIQHISGEASSMLDPMAALAESIDKAVNFSTSAAFRERSLQFMKESMGKYLDTRSSNPHALLTANVHHHIQKTNPKLANAIEAHQKFLANMLGQPDRFEASFSLLVDKYFQKAFNVTDEFFQKGGLSKETLESRQKRIDYFGQNPLTRMRALTFHTTLGLGSIPSFIMQAINVVNIAAISPKFGSKAAVQAPIMRMALFSRDKGTIDKMSKHYKAAGFKSAEEFKSYVEEFKNLGIDHIGNTHALIAGLNGAQVATGMTSKFLDKSRWFFDQGELLNRLTAYGAARRNWDEVIGKGKKASSQEGREWIAEETHRLTLGMSGADVQIGLRNNLVSIPAQFMSFPIRFLNAITPEAVGGSASFTGKEKGRIVLANLLAFGGAGVPLFDAVTSYLTETYEMDATTSKALTNGMIDSILFHVSDGEINSNFSGRAGNAEFLNQIMDAVSGDKNFLELLAGASGSRVTGFHSSLDEFYGVVKALVNPSLESISDASIKLLIENVSSLKGINRSYLAYTEGLLYSKQGSKLTKISKQGAIAMALGLPPQSYEDIGASLARADGRKEVIKDAVIVHNTLLGKYMKASSDGEKQEYLKAIMAHSALLSTQGIEGEVAQKMLSQEARGTLLEYLAQQEQLRKDSTPDEGIKSHSEQFIQQNLED